MFFVGKFEVDITKIEVPVRFFLGSISKIATGDTQILLNLLMNFTVKNVLEIDSHLKVLCRSISTLSTQYFPYMLEFGAFKLYNYISFMITRICDKEKKL